MLDLGPISEERGCFFAPSMAPTSSSEVGFSPSNGAAVPFTPTPVFFISTADQTPVTVIGSVVGVCILGAISCGIMLRIVISQLRQRRQQTAALARRSLRTTRPNGPRPIMYQVHLEWVMPFDQGRVNWETVQVSTIRCAI